MEGFLQFQLVINLAMQALGGWLLLPMKAVSFLGQEEFFLVALPAFYWCIDAGSGLRLGIMLVLTHGLNLCLKLAFAQPRPYWVDRRVAALAVEPTFGLPSGHSQNGMALWGLAAWAQRRRWLWVLAISVAILTGISRIYLGVHFFSDVLLGWLVGGLLLWAYIRLETPVLKRVRRLPLAKLLLVIWVTALLFIAVSLWLGSMVQPLSATWVDNAAAAGGGTPAPTDPNTLFTLAGVWLGLASGAAWYWRKFGPPSAGGPWKQRILRYLVGLIGVALIYFGLSAIFPRTPDVWGLSLRLLRYTVLGLWVSALAPLVFQRLRLV